jgi:hypothetical protein
VAGLTNKETKRGNLRVRAWSSQGSRRGRAIPGSGTTVLQYNCGHCINHLQAGLLRVRTGTARRKTGTTSRNMTCETGLASGLKGYRASVYGEYAFRVY